MRKTVVFLCLLFLGIGMLQTTLCEAACVPPAITVQPEDVAVEPGGEATFTVTATGDALSYQWKKDGADISGALTDSYTINSVTVADDGIYTCTVSTSCADPEPPVPSSVSSDPATLAVLLQFSIFTEGSGAFNSTVKSTPAGIDCGADCDELYRYNTPVSLNAIPGDSTIFIGWTSGDCPLDNNPVCALPMNEAHSATATFMLTSVLEGTVTAASSGKAIAGVTVVADNGVTPKLSAVTDGAGNYSFPTIFVGTYTVTATKFNYKITPVTGVVVNENPPTTLDFQLEDAAMYTLSGVVTDKEVGWPLYADVDWKYLSDSANFVGTGRTDPVTGEYSIELPEGKYAVSASAQGYFPKGVPPMDLTTSDATQNFELRPDMAIPTNKTTCTAQGYKWAAIALSEDFNSCGIPEGWTIQTPDDQPGDCDWVIADPDPGLTGNNTGGTGCFADADGIACGVNDGKTMYTELLTPVLDFTPLGETPTLRFKVNFETETSNPKPGSIRIDIFTGTTGTWTGPFEGDPDSKGTSILYHRTNLKGTQEFDLTSWAADESHVQIRFTFKFDGLKPSWIQIDDVDVFNSTCVIPTTGGIVVGNVYDENTNVGLNGALVDNGDVNNVPFLNSVFTVATPIALDDGFYSMYLENSGPVSLTATLDKYGPSTENPVIPLLDRVRQDFYLPAGQLSADPSAFEVHMAPDTSLTLPMSILNNGGASGDFEIFERYFTAPPAPGVNQENILPGSDLGISAFGVDIIDTQDDSLVVFPDVGTPGTMDVIATNLSTNYASGDFIDGDYSKMYVLDNQNNRLLTISTADGTETEIGQPATVAGEIWTGLTVAPDGTVYASSSSNACNDSSTSTLYTINPATGAETIIDTITNTTCIMDIAIDSAGNLYGVDTYTDYLVQINPADGTGTLIGASGLGIDASLGQGLDFDSSDTLYWASYNEITGGAGELRTIDTSSGESTLVEAFPAGTHIDCLAFTADYLGEIPWLAETPTSGTLDSGFFQEISLDFDSTGYTEGTTETGFLSVATTTPYGTFNVPVIMVVEPPRQLTITKEFYGGAAGDVVDDIVPEPVVDCGATCTGDYPYNTELTLTTTATTGTFLGWAGGCTGTNPVCDITINQPQDVTAIFYDPTAYPGLQVLGVGIAGSGTGSVVSKPAAISCGDGNTDCLAGFVDGTAVTLTAKATKGTNSIFMGWTGACSGNNTSCTVTMDQVRYVSATFTNDTPGATNDLSVALPGNGSGEVSSSPVGIFCGTAGNTCTAPFDDVATVTLAATPATGTTFSGWTGGDCSGTNPICTLTMNKARNVSAIFTLNSYELTVNKDGKGNGTAISAPAGINCGSDCSEWYYYGSQVVLTAEPDTHSALAGWQGSCNEPITDPPSPTCTVDISQTEDITVIFDPEFPWPMFLPAITGAKK